MIERLIFVTLIEQEATRQLLEDNFATMIIANVGNETEFALDIVIDCDPKLFFKWAFTSQVLAFCFNMSLDLHDPPVYMKEALRELHETRLLSE